LGAASPLVRLTKRLASIASRLRRERDRAFAVLGEARAVERVELSAGREERGVVGVAADEAVEQQQVGGGALHDQLGIFLLEDRCGKRIRGHRADEAGTAARRGGGDDDGDERTEPPCTGRLVADGPPRPDGYHSRSRSCYRTRCARGPRRLASDLFLDTSGLAAALAQVIELRATHVAATLHLDVRDGRAVRLEHALDAFAVRDLAHRERRVETAIALR